MRRMFRFSHLLLLFPAFQTEASSELATVASKNTGTWLVLEKTWLHEKVGAGCTDLSNTWKDAAGLTCSEYVGSVCNRAKSEEYASALNGKNVTANDVCCGCGGGIPGVCSDKSATASALRSNGELLSKCKDECLSLPWCIAMVASPLGTTFFSGLRGMGDGDTAGEIP